MPRSLHAAVVTALLLASAVARAQVDCDTPDDLCTGDPCVVATVEVGDPCVLDFGSRTVVIDGTLKLPNSGELSLTAGRIELEGRIQNLPGSVPGLGPRITLAADVIVADGNIKLARALRTLQPGELTLQAADALTIDSVISAMTSPTTIRWIAGPGGIEFNGRLNTAKPGGALQVDAGGSVGIQGSFRRVEQIDVTAGGDVTLARGSRLIARTSLNVDAGGELNLDTVLRDYGSDVTLRGGLGVIIQRTINNSPLFIDDGSVTIASSAGPVHVLMPIKANIIAITAAGDITLDALVAASPPTRSGGPVDIESTGGAIIVNAPVTAQSGDGVSPGDGAGGHVRLIAAGPVDVRERVLVNAFPQADAAPGGTIEVEGSSVVVGPEVTFDADGDPPGPDFPGAPPAGFRITATAGAVALDGTFHARGGPSLMQVTATGNVSVVGDYRVAPSGCIGLDAGGTLTTSGATFDTPPVAVCP